MRLLVLHQGYYGGRIIEYIRKAAPGDWIIDTISSPRGLPVIIDEPEEFLPAHIPQADLLLALSESEQTAQLVPAIANKSNSKAVIMPVDNSAWLPLGLQNQLQAEIAKMGKAAVFPKTFCTLTEIRSALGKILKLMITRVSHPSLNISGIPNSGLSLTLKTKVYLRSWWNGALPAAQPILLLKNW